MRLRPRGLLGLLHLRHGRRPLPWVNEAAEDCKRLKVHGDLPASFPDFFSEPAAWHAPIADERGWKNLVDSLYFVESVTDKQVEETCSASRVLAHRCSRCARAFASRLALEAHCRAKHGDRLGIRRYVRTPVCPACGTDYRERLRCISHLPDRRRPACAEWVRYNVAPMPDDQLRHLDEVDKNLRREAWRQGHTHHIAKLPALRPNGKAIGKTSG